MAGYSVANLKELENSAERFGLAPAVEARFARTALDAEESSVPGGFTRTSITTHAGIEAWAYAYGDGLTLTPIESGDWLNR